jgi:hypothetical protein
MSFYARALKDSQAVTDAFNLMDVLSLGYDTYADETGSAALTLNTIVAIPDIYANSALLKQDPAGVYSSAADNFSPRIARKVSFAV